MRILVAFSSKHGATGDIARWVASTLRDRGQDAEARSVQEDPDPGAYDAVVVGSAIYFGAWTKPARAYVERHRERLGDRPLWLFSSGPTGTAAAQDPRELSGLEAALHPRGHRVFAGALVRDRLSLAERIAVRAAHAPLGDFRDRAAIASWAGEVADALAELEADSTPKITTM